jgi:hypothetical protein
MAGSSILRHRIRLPPRRATPGVKRQELWYKFAASNRAGGTEQENRAVVRRSIAMLGTFAVNPAGKTLTFKVERATFPNWDGTEQQRLIVVANSEELKYVTPTASSGGLGTVTWRRLK